MLLEDFYRKYSIVVLLSLVIYLQLFHCSCEIHLKILYHFRLV